MVNKQGAQIMSVAETATFDWPHVIKTLRTFVASRVKADNDTLAYIKMQMLETDTFHDYSSMDTLYNRLTDSVDERVWDALYEAIDQMGQQIIDHFADAWNFGPGYVKPKKLVVPDVERMSRAVGDKLLKEAAPFVFADMKQYEKERKASQLAIKKEKAAAISDERVVELAKLYNDNLLAACDKAVRGFKKRLWPDDMSFFEMTEEQLKGFNIGSEFLAALEAKYPEPSKLFDKCFETVISEKAFTRKRTDDFCALYYDKAGRKRLIAAISA
jgi:hypothetical protein